MENVNYIITAKHYSVTDGADGSVKGRILKKRDELKRKNVSVNIIGLDDPGGESVHARIWSGHWIADCPCNGAEFVDPDEPIFFCFSCGNRANGGRVRPVVFPSTEDRAEIERLLLDRPVNELSGLTDSARAGNSQPLITVEVKNESGGTEHRQLGRDWLPSESVADIRKQNKAVDTLKGLSGYEKNKRVLVGLKEIFDEQGKSLFKFGRKKGRKP